MSPLVRLIPGSDQPDPSQLASVSPEAPQSDADLTATPKPKKKKSKKSKKTAATTTDLAKPVVSGEASGYTSTGEEYHTYDPFTSQLSHIDAIRRAVKYDTTSYFARTNARIEKEAEEQKEADQSSKARKFYFICNGDVTNMYL